MEEHDILTALDNQQFAIWFQPQVDIASGKICGAEVLLRQRQADGSWSLPSDLIERIESCGMMVPVGYWVMEEAGGVAEARDHAAALGERLASATAAS